MNIDECDCCLDDSAPTSDINLCLDCMRKLKEEPETIVEYKYRNSWFDSFMSFMWFALFSLISLIWSFYYTGILWPLLKAIGVEEW